MRFELYWALSTKSVVHCHNNIRIYTIYNILYCLYGTDKPNWTNEMKRKKNSINAASVRYLSRYFVGFISRCLCSVFSIFLSLFFSFIFQFHNILINFFSGCYLDRFWFGWVLVVSFFCVLTHFLCQFFFILSVNSTIHISTIWSYFCHLLLLLSLLENEQRDRGKCANDDNSCNAYYVSIVHACAEFILFFRSLFSKIFRYVYWCQVSERKTFFLSMSSNAKTTPRNTQL